MSLNAANNKRIARNTLLLYIRMGLVMLISLYVARVVLSVLGEDDYGIYNVVGGVVVMFSFLSSTLASASQRFFAFELGRGNYENLNRIFNINLILFCIVTLIIILLAETVGLWFLNTRMTIPAERMGAANWIYQFSILSFCTNIIAIPYQATIIARERMNFYALVGIMEALLKLAFVLLLMHMDWGADVLIVYGALMLVVSIITNGAYVTVARRHFEETRIRFYWEKKQAAEIVSYSGWNLFGAIANVVRSQGINILINVFFNPAVNAARALSYQVNSALNQFANNFFTAVKPQVTKYYAQGDREATFNLVFSSSKFAYYLLLFLAVPVLVFTGQIIDLWLVDVPDYTVLFVKLVVIIGLIDSAQNPLITLVHATGRVRLYKAVVGTIIILNLPISWVFLKHGYPAETTMYVAIAISVIALILRLIILRRIVTFPILKYCYKVLLPLIVTTAVSFLLSWVIKIFVFNAESGLLNLCVAVVLSMVVTVLAIFAVGLTGHERKAARNLLISNHSQS